VTLADMLERDWQRQVVDLALTFGYDYYHTYRSKKSPAGFPDLVLVGRRVIFCELKRENTHPSPLQVAWLRRLHAAGAEVYLLRPRHLQDLARVLGARGRPMALWTADQVESRHVLLLELDSHLLREDAA
jgi:hypothetical protein